MNINPYVQVLNTYLTRRLLMVGMLGATFTRLLPITIGWLWGEPNAMPPIFLFFLAVPAIMVGGHVKQQMACPQANLMPSYHRRHLTVAGLMFLVPVLCGVLTAIVVDGSALGHVTLLLFVCLAFFQVSTYGNGFSGLVIGALSLATLVPQIRLAVQQMLAGQLPGLAWSLLSAEAAFAVLLFQRLANITEDDPSYAAVMQMNALETRRRVQRQRPPKDFLSQIEAESRKLDRLTQQSAETRGQRVALLRMAGDGPVNMLSVLLILIVMEAGLLIVRHILFHKSAVTTAEEFAGGRAWPIMLSLLFALMFWPAQSPRWSRLGCESLRPSTRKAWVLENGLALIRNTLAMQVVWLLVQIGVLLTMLAYRRWCRIDLL